MPIYGYCCAHFEWRKTSSRHLGSFSARRGFHAIRKDPSSSCIWLPVQIIGAKYRVWTLRKVNIISLQSLRTFSLRSAVSVDFLFLISLKKIYKVQTFCWHRKSFTASVSRSRKSRLLAGICMAKFAKIDKRTKVFNNTDSAYCILILGKLWFGKVEAF